MVLEGFVTQTLNGIQFGLVLFIIAVGISISLGILQILNLAHGELYALGAFLAFSITEFLLSAVGLQPPVSSVLLFIAAALVAAAIAALIVGGVGAIIEVTFFRRIYERHELYQLLLTFAVLLIVRDFMKFWPSLGVRLNQVYATINSVRIGHLVGLNYPTYNIYVIIIGTVLFAATIWVFDNTKTGRIIRGTAIDREMATAIGVDTTRVFTVVFVASVFLAGFAGALILPRSGAQIGMGDTPLVLSFVVVVIGGIGSVKGTFVAALLVGVLSRWATWQYPPAELAAPFVIMAIILMIKPGGLFSTWGELE
jgi:branched-chain amino acid transport system permease protein